jgi:serine protease inhibitor
LSDRRGVRKRAAAVISAIALVSSASAQGARESITVDARDANGRRPASWHASWQGVSHAGGDSTGPVTLSVPRGTRGTLRVRSLGYAFVDTLINVGQSAARHFDIRLTPARYWEGRDDAADGDSIADRPEVIDSIARGLVVRDSTAAAYVSLSGRVLETLDSASGRRINVVLSPLSVGQTLAIGWFGAAGRTADELRSVLGVNDASPTAIARRDLAFNERVARRTDITLQVSSMLWLDRQRQLAPAFLARGAGLSGQVRSVELRDEATVDSINAWVRRVTNEKIKAVLEGPLHPKASLVVTNAVYLKAEWQLPFDADDTEDATFFRGRSGPVQVRMMDDIRNVSLGVGQDYRAIRLPFRGGLASAFVLLPDSSVPLERIVHRYAVGQIVLPDGAAGPTQVHVRLPRLKLDFKTSLIPALKRLGVRDAFDPTRADFRDLVKLEPDERTYVSKVEHVAVLELDEKGVVAAAASGVEAVTITSVAPPPIPFFVNRPFLLIVQDERTGTPLFVAVVRDPS